MSIYTAPTNTPPLFNSTSYTAPTGTPTGLLYSRNQSVPVSVSGTNTVSAVTGSTLMSVDVPIGVSITPSAGYATVMVGNGSQLTNYTFHPLNASLMNSAGLTVTPYTHLRVVYTNSIATSSQLNWQIVYIP